MMQTTLRVNTKEVHHQIQSVYSDTKRAYVCLCRNPKRFCCSGFLRWLTSFLHRGQEKVPLWLVLRIDSCSTDLQWVVFNQPFIKWPPLPYRKTSLPSECVTPYRCDLRQTTGLLLAYILSRVLYLIIIGPNQI